MKIYRSQDLLSFFCKEWDDVAWMLGTLETFRPFLWRLLSRICTALLFILQLLVAFHAQADCTGPFKGKRPTPEQLQKILAAANKAFDEEAEDISIYLERVDLCEADLSGANLSGAKLNGYYDLKKFDYGYSYSGEKKKGDNLSGANLSEANLSRADLSIANLSGANLSRANLSGANLSRANLSGVNLRGANLSGANLSSVNLSGFDLSGADLSMANLSGANLSSINLSGADLSMANLSGANLSSVNLSGADLSMANLSGANLSSVNLSGYDLSGADLSMANLSRANLSRANLSEANLGKTNLNGANLSEANLSVANLGEADLSRANLARTVFMPKSSSLPIISKFAIARNLDQMVIDSSSLPIISQLREEFQKTHFRDAERSMIYLVKQQQEEGEGPLERWFSRVFFNWTCGYGLYPGRCLKILFGVMGMLSFAYLYALRRTDGRGGLWAIWSNDRLNKSEGQDEPVRLIIAQPFPASFPAAAPRYDPFAGLRSPPNAGPSTQDRAKPLWGYLLTWLRPWSVACYFSLLSAFHFGWRDLNVGNWIARIQPREYALRPTGWVRVLSGLQSLVSVYLVALWVLSYFGRPFE